MTKKKRKAFTTLDVNALPGISGLASDSDFSSSNWVRNVMASSKTPKISNRGDTMAKAIVQSQIKFSDSQVFVEEQKVTTREGRKRTQATTRRMRRKPVSGKRLFADKSLEGAALETSQNFTHSRDNEPVVTKDQEGEKKVLNLVVPKLRERASATVAAGATVSRREESRENTTLSTDKGKGQIISGERNLNDDAKDTSGTESESLGIHQSCQLPSSPQKQAKPVSSLSNRSPHVNKKKIRMDIQPVQKSDMTSQTLSRRHTPPSRARPLFRAEPAIAQDKVIQDKTPGPHNQAHLKNSETRAGDPVQQGKMEDPKISLLPGKSLLSRDDIVCKSPGQADSTKLSRWESMNCASDSSDVSSDNNDRSLPLRVIPKELEQSLHNNMRTVDANDSKLRMASIVGDGTNTNATPRGGKDRVKHQHVLPPLFPIGKESAADAMQEEGIHATNSAPEAPTSGRSDSPAKELHSTTNNPRQTICQPENLNHPISDIHATTKAEATKKVTDDHLALLNNDIMDRVLQRPPDNEPILKAMLASEPPARLGLHGSNLVGSIIGGRQLQQAQSLDESEVTMYTGSTVHAEGLAGKPNRAGFGSRMPKMEELNARPPRPPKHDSNQVKRRRVMFARQRPSLPPPLDKVQESSDSVTAWSLDDGAASVPIEFAVAGKRYRHPPLPPGWQIRISDTQHRPFYVHPDFGTTWHCPVVLPPLSAHLRSKGKERTPTKSLGRNDAGQQSKSLNDLEISQILKSSSSIKILGRPLASLSRGIQSEGSMSETLSDVLRQFNAYLLHPRDTAPTPRPSPDEQSFDTLPVFTTKMARMAFVGGEELDLLASNGAPSNCEEKKASENDVQAEKQQRRETSSWSSPWPPKPRPNSPNPESSTFPKCYPSIASAKAMRHMTIERNLSPIAKNKSSSEQADTVQGIGQQSSAVRSTTHSPRDKSVEAMGAQEIDGGYNGGSDRTFENSASTAKGQSISGSREGSNLRPFSEDKSRTKKHAQWDLESAAKNSETSWVSPDHNVENHSKSPTSAYESVTSVCYQRRRPRPPSDVVNAPKKSKEGQVLFGGLNHKTAIVRLDLSEEVSSANACEMKSSNVSSETTEPSPMVQGLEEGQERKDKEEDGSRHCRETDHQLQLHGLNRSSLENPVESHSNDVGRSPSRNKTPSHGIESGELRTPSSAGRRSWNLPAAPLFERLNAPTKRTGTKGETLGATGRMNDTAQAKSLVIPSASSSKGAKRTIQSTSTESGIGDKFQPSEAAEPRLGLRTKRNRTAVVLHQARGDHPSRRGERHPHHSAGTTGCRSETNMNSESTKSSERYLSAGYTTGNSSRTPVSPLRPKGRIAQIRSTDSTSNKSESQRMLQDRNYEETQETCRRTAGGIEGTVEKQLSVHESSNYSFPIGGAGTNDSPITTDFSQEPSDITPRIPDIVTFKSPGLSSILPTSSCSSTLMGSFEAPSPCANAAKATSKKKGDEVVRTRIHSNLSCSTKNWVQCDDSSVAPNPQLQGCKSGESQPNEFKAVTAFLSEPVLSASDSSIAHQAKNHSTASVATPTRRLVKGFMSSRVLFPPLPLCALQNLEGLARANRNGRKRKVKAKQSSRINFVPLT